MKTKKSPASSRPGKLIRRSEADIRAYAKSSAAKETSARLRARGAEPTAADMKDVPLFDGTLSRPVKAPVTVRIDLDILAWLKAKGGPYQTHMNATLRSAMLAERSGHPSNLAQTLKILAPHPIFQRSEFQSQL